MGRFSLSAGRRESLVDVLPSRGKKMEILDRGKSGALGAGPGLVGLMELRN